MNNYELDDIFLKSLFLQRRRETYVRVTALSIDEIPKQSLEGVVTQGSVSVQGESSLRRTCSLSFVTKGEILDYYWSLTSKFKLEIGLKNEIDFNYPEIIYFPLGVYIITDFSYNIGVNQINISIQGKDKMCLLNGEVGGQLYASHDFGTIDIIDEAGVLTRKDVNIETIIRDAVHEYGMEPFNNIIIKDVPKYGLFMMKYMGDKDNPLYYLIDANDTTRIIDTTTDKNTSYEWVNSLNKEEKPYLKLSDIEDGWTENQTFYEYNTLLNKEQEFVQVNYNGTICYVYKVLTGYNAGYKLTELTYPRDATKDDSGLICGVGEAITSALDKIVTMLGDYEYFYNVHGQFIFQKKNKFMDKTWDNIDFNESLLLNQDKEMTVLTNRTWDFNQGEFVISYNNSPQINNIRNDFSIWGTRSAGDKEYPVHLRYAIDKKPTYYKTIRVTQEEVDAWKKIYPEFVGLKPQESKIYYAEGSKESAEEGAKCVDWREIIYQMAMDYYHYGHFDTFNLRIMEANEDKYPGGRTGYEQYYGDMQGFWRQIYDDPEDIKAIVEKTTKDLNYSMTLGKYQYPIYIDKRYKKVEENANLYVTGELVFYGDRSALLKYLEENRIFSKGKEDIDEYRKNLFFYKNSNIEGDNIYISNKYILAARTIDVTPDQLDALVEFAKTAKSKSKEEWEAAKFDLYSFYYKVDTEEYFKAFEWSDCDYGFSPVETDKYSEGIYTIGKKVNPETGEEEEVENFEKVFVKSAQMTGIYPARLLEGKKTYPEDFYEINEKGNYIIARELNNLPLGVEPVGYAVSSTTSRINIQDLDACVDKLYRKSYNNFNTEMQKITRSSLGDLYYRTEEGERTLTPTQAFWTTKESIKYYQQTDDLAPKKWKEDLVIKSPETLNFWFDFLDESDLDKYSVKNIMHRPKSVKDDKAKAICYRDNFNVIFLMDEEDFDKQKYKEDLAFQERVLPYIESAYQTVYYKENMAKNFEVSNTGKSCKDVLDEYLYQYTHANESVNITCAPIYYMEPGDRIITSDGTTGMAGEYYVNNISIPLNYNGTMNIGAIKKVEKLY